MPDSIAHLSSLAGSHLLDSNGSRLGRVEDVVARLDLAEPLPQVVGLKARIGGRQLFVPIRSIAELGPEDVRASTMKLNLGQFERRAGEVLLRRDLLDHSVINVETARLVRAREVELLREDGVWRVAGIDAGLRRRLRRLVPRFLRGPDAERSQFIPWSAIEAFVSHVPTSRLKLASRRLARLHPAQIADLVEAASHDEGEEILAAVGIDKELEADVFEELDDHHQVEFLKERSNEDVAEVLGRMESDDAADLLLEIEQSRRLPILALLSVPKQLKIRSLLGHNPSTAGGLMNPDFVLLRLDTPVGAALDRLRTGGQSPRAITTICVVDAEGAYAGAVALSQLVLAGAERLLATLVETPIPTVTTDADLPEVAQTMADYNLIDLPVVDADGKPVGMIGVDDVIELLLPEEWRRRTGAARS